MTYEECVNCLPAELKALGYKMVNRRTMIENVTNFHLDNDCQDCLLRIVHSNNEHCHSAKAEDFLASQ